MLSIVQISLNFKNGLGVENDELKICKDEINNIFLLDPAFLQIGSFYLQAILFHLSAEPIVIKPPTLEQADTFNNNERGQSF